MRVSANMIAKELGITRKEVYSLLKNKGFLNGGPGNWSITDLGKAIGGN